MGYTGDEAPHLQSRDVLELTDVHQGLHLPVGRWHIAVVCQILGLLLAVILGLDALKPRQAALKLAVFPLQLCSLLTLLL